MRCKAAGRERAGERGSGGRARARGEAPRRAAGVAVVVTAALGLGLGASGAACGDDDAAPPPPGDLGAPDAGADLGEPDAGEDDAGEGDAGRDLGPPDLGPPCDGPPGLYVEGSCAVLAPGVRRFEPTYTLWTDGAAKERFFFIPGSMRIESSNPDRWIFPVGSMFWKTFSLGGLRLETRILRKIVAAPGPSAWEMRVYKWSATQDSVEEVIVGEDDVLGTTHDIPSRTDCLTCHSGAAADAPLGFSAIQLNHDVSGDFVNLAMLQDERRLTVPVDLTDARVPGDSVARDALGYMHANCGNCHGGPAPKAGMTLWVDVGLRSLEATATYRTTVGVPSAWPPPGMGIDGVTARVAPGDPDASALIRRTGMRDGRDLNQMPPLGTEVVHTDGLLLLRRWVSSLRPTP
jgi:hypothetical protein